MNVGPCIKSPESPDDIPLLISLVVKVAAILIYPPVRAFPMHIMSGEIPAFSHANMDPVRPKPVAISSRIKRLLPVA